MLDYDSNQGWTNKHYIKFMVYVSKKRKVNHKPICLCPQNENKVYCLLVISCKFVINSLKDNNIYKKNRIKQKKQSKLNPHYLINYKEKDREHYVKVYVYVSIPRLKLLS